MIFALWLCIFVVNASVECRNDGGVRSVVLAIRSWANNNPSISYVDKRSHNSIAAGWLDCAKSSTHYKINWKISFLFKIFIILFGLTSLAIVWDVAHNGCILGRRRNNTAVRMANALAIFGPESNCWAAVTRLAKPDSPCLFNSFWSFCRPATSSL